MHRFLMPNIDLNATCVELTERREIHHLKNVLRLKAGSEVNIFNGQGQEASGIISSISKEKVSITVKKLLSNNSSKQKTLVLACAIPKKAKFETIIEKATELGVDEIVPLKTKRTEVVLKGERLAKKVQRYQTVAINAAKQSKRATVPRIHEITEFSAFIKAIDDKCTAFIPCLFGKRIDILSAIRSAESSRRIIFLIGPEGDFTPNEVESAKKCGCIPVSLGETVLKVDTAVISVIALANFLK